MTTVLMDVPAPLSPWPDTATALAFLRGLLLSAETKACRTEQPVFDTAQLDVAAVATWLQSHGLGPLARDAYRATWPALAHALQVDAMLAAAELELYLDALRAVIHTLATNGVEAALLKGVALALTAYPAPAQRTMSDVDIWVERGAAERAIAALSSAGFDQVQRPASAEPLRLSQRGKIVFNLPQWQIGGVEIHTDPFAGTLLDHVARVDLPAMWARTRPWSGLTGARLLAVEDLIIQVAVHLAVSNQFCFAAVRGLLDVALAARQWPVAWQALAERAADWGVGVPVWLVLDQAHALFGLDGVAPALARLAPSATRKRLLARYVTLDRVAAGYDFRPKQNRYIYLALLTSALPRLTGRPTR